MRWRIDKQFDFCYGHRVWSQSLIKEYSLDSCLACRHLHGHQGKIKIVLEADHLVRGMVTDFKHLNWVKDMIDSVLDHKFIFDINDPLFWNEFPEASAAHLIDMAPYKGVIDKDLWVKIFNLDKLLFDNDWNLDNPEHKALYEKYEGVVVVDFVPTSENLAAWIGKVVQNRMGDDFNVVAVDYWETPKSHCHVELDRISEEDKTPKSVMKKIFSALRGK